MPINDKKIILNLKIKSVILAKVGTENMWI